MPDGANGRAAELSWSGANQGGTGEVEEKLKAWRRSLEQRKRSTHADLTSAPCLLSCKKLQVPPVLASGSKAALSSVLACLATEVLERAGMAHAACLEEHRSAELRGRWMSSTPAQHELSNLRHQLHMVLRADLERRLQERAKGVQPPEPQFGSVEVRSSAHQPLSVPKALLAGTSRRTITEVFTQAVTDVVSDVQYFLTAQATLMAIDEATGSSRASTPTHAGSAASTLDRLSSSPASIASSLAVAVANSSELISDAASVTREVSTLRESLIAVTRSMADREADVSSAINLAGCSSSSSSTCRASASQGNLASSPSTLTGPSSLGGMTTFAAAANAYAREAAQAKEKERISQLEDSIGAVDASINHLEGRLLEAERTATAQATLRPEELRQEISLGSSKPPSLTALQAKAAALERDIRAEDAKALTLQGNVDRLLKEVERRKQAAPPMQTQAPVAAGLANGS
eukprot:TRINITY_DN60555_c0_g1_i1.p1 TRINITY_DN60555_c0_g1~~TRINITY_DN60555_c0_g1_i1.p1  ORF type:complete len:463 (+),score=112.90 TRINITY_DN60555_c0_g1_i1:59-1447(+)